MRARTAMALLPWLAAAAHGQDVDLRGRVLEKARLQPVAGALVKIAGGTLSTLTGPDGRFRLQGTPTATGGGKASGPAFLLSGGRLRAAGGRPGSRISVEILDLEGRRMASADALHPGPGGNVALPSVPDGFLGILRVTTEGATMTARILSLGGNLQSGMPLRQTASPAAAARRSAAAPEVAVSIDKLLPRTVAAAGNSADLGDVVLDYPPRKLGLGAAAPYGADQLIPAAGDSASARAHVDSLWIHKMNSWRQGQGLGTTPVLWKVMPDPAAPAGTYRPSLSPCCLQRNGSPGWGYDDIITKKAYGDIQVHVEFNMMGLPDGNTNSSGYCNSGVYLKGSLELQIETPKANPTQYEKMHGICTLIDLKLPDKDMYPGPGIWQSYDITLRAARADSPAKVTVYWNGEKVHDNANWKSAGASPKVGFALQNEYGSDVRYRNVWLKELDIAEPRTDFGY